MDGSVPRRFRRLVVGATVVLCSVALIPVSVLLLMVVSRSAQVDWNQLSDVSQALGIASALLSGAALIAVAISIRLQSQPTRSRLVRFRRRSFRLLLGRAFMSDDVRNASRDIRLAYTVSGWPHEFQRFAEIVDRVLASTREGAEDVADSGVVEDGQP
jgi:hypothetical protein